MTDLQALAGSESNIVKKRRKLMTVLPISQIPSLPACMYQAGRILPLEYIFRVPPPESSEEDDRYATKKTWREPREAVTTERQAVWTAGSIMEGRALDRGYRKFASHNFYASRLEVADDSDCQGRKTRREPGSQRQ